MYSYAPLSVRLIQQTLKPVKFKVVFFFWSSASFSSPCSALTSVRCLEKSWLCSRADLPLKHLLLCSPILQYLRLVPLQQANKALFLSAVVDTASGLTIVFYIGGITFAEIAALRWLKSHCPGEHPFFIIIPTTSSLSLKQR